MPDHHVYLRIEPIYNYSPVDPHPGGPRPYRRDCMRNEGHEDATIPLAEADARRLAALIYREYLDPGYTIPKPDKLVAADVNEPAFTRRVPGTVIYARPRERLFIHVFNGDVEPHSFHVHGLKYGIESDGSYPFGTENASGRRSDEICPGDEWTYVFDVTEQMVGAWPFHDHYVHLMESVNRGLFGGLVVLPRRPRIDQPGRSSSGKTYPCTGRAPSGVGATWTAASVGDGGTPRISVKRRTSIVASRLPCARRSATRR